MKYLLILLTIFIVYAVSFYICFQLGIREGRQEVINQYYSKIVKLERQVKEVQLWFKSPDDFLKQCEGKIGN